MRVITAMLAVALFLVSLAGAQNQAFLFKYPRFVQGQAGTGTPGTGVPFAVLGGARAATAGTYAYKPRLILTTGAAAQQINWVDSTSPTPFIWALDNIAWANCPTFYVPSATGETAKVWAAVKCATTTVGERDTLRFRIRIGTSNIDSPNQNDTVKVLDMTSSGNGGWLTGHIYAPGPGAPRQNCVVLAFDDDMCVGSCFTENNKIIEGYDSTDAGYFYMAVRAGTIDSLQVYARTEFVPSPFYTQIPAPWTVVPGGTTSVDLTLGPTITDVARNIAWPYSNENVNVWATITPPTGGTIDIAQLQYSTDGTNWTSSVADSTASGNPSVYYFHFQVPTADSVLYRIYAHSINPVSESYSSIVKVMIPLERTIYQIQGQASSSPLVGKYVHTAGIVTGICGKDRVYIGTASGGPWNGLLFYRGADTITLTLTLGDSIDISGTIAEFQQQTQIGSSVRTVRNGTNRPYDTTRVSLAQAKLEDYEGVLVEVDTVRMLQSGVFAGNGTYHCTTFEGLDTMVVYTYQRAPIVGQPIPQGYHTLVANVADYTGVGRELVPSNIGAFTFIAPDVQLASILAPAETVVVGEPCVPEVNITNLSTINTAANFTTRFTIAPAGGGVPVYNVQSGFVSVAPGVTLPVLFTNWNAYDGDFAIKAYVEYGADPNRSNDTLERLLFVRTRDVGVTQINYPADTAFLNVSVTPQVRLVNAGNIVATLSLQVTITGPGGIEYDRTVNGIVLAPEQVLDYSLADAWTPANVGDYVASVSVTTAYDNNLANNQVTENILVLTGPASPVLVTPANHAQINDPTPFFSWQTSTGANWYQLQVSTDPAFVEPCLIDVQQTSTTYVPVAGLADGQYYWRVRASANNGLDWGAYQAEPFDFELDATPPAPPQLVTPGPNAVDVAVNTVFDWEAPEFKRIGAQPNSGKFKYAGTDAVEAYLLQVARDAGFNQLVYDVEVLGVVTEWAQPGPTYLDYGTRYWWRVRGEDNFGNVGDWGTGTFTTVTNVVPPGGWTARPDTMIGAPVRDGGGITYNADKGLMYAIKGGKTNEFWQYNPVETTWTKLTDVTAGTKPVNKGAAITTGGGFVYVLKGNNTYDFYKYDIEAGTWAACKPLPKALDQTATRGKAAKGGGSLAYVYTRDSSFVYTLKGSGTNEFYRYDVARDTFFSLAPAPYNTKAKYDKGSWIAYDGSRFIYLMQNKYNALFKYDVVNEAWVTTPTLDPMPLVGRSGKSKKVGDGSCAAFNTNDGYLFAMKGNNTQEAWKYLPGTSDTWVELETIPQAYEGGKKKKVKAGAGVAYYPATRVFFVQKGNKSNQFWKYVPGSVVYASRPQREGIAVSGLTSVGHSLAIAPNPLAGGQAVVRYTLPRAGMVSLSVCDVTGRVVMERTFAAGRTGVQSLDLRGLSAGVYLVKLDASGFTLSQKLVVER